MSPALSVDLFLYWLGIAAVAVNALTGVLDAQRKEMDLVGALLVGTATALGGGTVRDLLLDRNVFWVVDQTYLLTSFATGALTFFIARRFNLPERLFLIPDAVGLALFTALGTQVALQWHAPWLVASLMGMTTGVVGGVLTVIGLGQLGLTPMSAAWGGMAVTLLLRLLAMRYHITLPAFRSR